MRRGSPSCPRTYISLGGSEVRGLDRVGPRRGIQILYILLASNVRCCWWVAMWHGCAFSCCHPPYSNLFYSWRISVSVLLNLLTCWLVLLLRKICRASWFHLLLSGKQDWKFQIKRFEEMLIKKQWIKGNHNSTLEKNWWDCTIDLIWWARVMCLVQIFPAYKTVIVHIVFFCVLLIVLYAW